MTRRYSQSIFTREMDATVGALHKRLSFVMLGKKIERTYGFSDVAGIRSSGTLGSGPRRRSIRWMSKTSGERASLPPEINEDRQPPISHARRVR